jgi:hypothetical protein
MAAVWSGVAGHVIPEQSLLTLASRIYEEHGSNVHLKVYTDEEWLFKTLTQYNGVQGKEHGTYKFTQIDWNRTERLASATDLRAAARSGDRARFYKDMGIKPSVTINVNDQEMPIFDVVAHFLNQYPDKVARPKKAATPHKATVAQLEEELQQLAIQHLSEFSKPQGKLSKNQDDASQGHILMRDVGGYDRTYHLNRIMMAAAMADGASKKPVKMDASAWTEKYNVAIPYTDAEHLMMFQAMATIPSDAQELSKRGKSKEPDDTNKTSPIAKPKRNKYGI